MMKTVCSLLWCFPTCSAKSGLHTKFGRLRLHYTFEEWDLFLTRNYRTAHVISEIITQPEGRMITIFFRFFWNFYIPCRRSTSAVKNTEWHILRFKKGRKMLNEGLTTYTWRQQKMKKFYWSDLSRFYLSIPRSKFAASKKPKTTISKSERQYWYYGWYQYGIAIWLWWGW